MHLFTRVCVVFIYDNLLEIKKKGTSRISAEQYNSKSSNTYLFFKNMSKKVWNNY